jgi:hypothetical protein
MREQLREKPSDEPKVPIIELRVPGPWVSPDQLDAALKDRGTGFHLDEGSIVNFASGVKVEFGVSDHDNEIGPIFRGGHHGRMSEEELLAVGTHAVKVHVTGPGGSADAARPIVQAAAALVRAGGYGVFVDNSGNCHGPEDFLKLAGDTQPGGLYWTFVALTGSREQNAVGSTGMHCLGLRDCELLDPPDDGNLVAFLLHNFLGYTYQSGATIHDGDILGGDMPGVPRFRAVHQDDQRMAPGTPMHNPYGRPPGRPAHGARHADAQPVRPVAAGADDRGVDEGVGG